MAGLLAVSGCGDWFGKPESAPLPGERISVLSLNRTVRADPRVADVQVRLPRPEANKEWPQSGGTASNAMHHLAASGGLDPLWRVDIGSGSSSNTQLLAQPVVAGGRVFTIDVDAEVRAFDAASGEELWDADLARDVDDDGVLGGGLAVDDGRVYATTGFAEVIALDAKTGQEIWRRRLSGPMRASPTVADDRVFVVTVNNEIFALRADNGRTIWSHAGLAETAGLLGGAAPAVEGNVVVVPYSSGEISAFRVENGRNIWTDSLVALRRTDPVSSIPHIRGRPVIDRGKVFVVGHSGRMVSIDLATGTRIWEQPIGGLFGPWVAGDFVYVISNNAELICLIRRDGRIRWVRQLRKFENEKDQQDPIRWAGPVLAGDRLLVAGTNSEIWSVSPYSGMLLGRIKVPGPVMIAPAVAGQTVFLLTDKADLIALR